MYLRTPLILLPFATSVVNAALFGRQAGVDTPACALACATALEYGKCAPEDTSCLCNNQAFAKSYSACVQGACAGNQLTLGVAYFESACNEAGVDVAISVTTTPPAGPTAGIAARSVGNGPVY
ncbi:hypothetical protein AX16_007820 [Volvariella volvacea WC 439]|nr:hypothetical protein AX16_007820 [Volvariella volvacea WC 439]